MVVLNNANEVNDGRGVIEVHYKGQRNCDEIMVKVELQNEEVVSSDEKDNDVALIDHSGKIFGDSERNY